MTVERQQNVFGFVTTITVDVPPVATLPPGLLARLEHHVEGSLRIAARRIAWHVIEWPTRQAVLRRLSAADAEALGVQREWRLARAESSA